MELSNFPLTTTFLLWIGRSDGPNGRKVSRRDAQCTGSVRLSDFDLISKVVCGLVAFQYLMTVAQCACVWVFPIFPLTTTLLVGSIGLGNQDGCGLVGFSVNNGCGGAAEGWTQINCHSPHCQPHFWLEVLSLTIKVVVVQ